MKKLLESRFLLGIAALLAVAALIVGFRNANIETGSLDFQYSAARLVVEGINPYLLYPIDKSRFLLTQGPNYLPLLYLLLLPIGAMDWPTARLVWSILNTLVGLFVAWRLAKGYGGAKAFPRLGVIAACLFVASTPFRNTIGNGQLGLVVTAALILASDSRSPLARGALLALAATKLSLGAMFVCLVAALRQWRVLLVCGAVTLLSFGLFAILTGTPPGLDLLLGPVHAVRAGIHYTPPINWLVERWGADAAIALNLAALGGFLAAVAFFRRGKPALELSRPIPERMILAASLLALISAPHFIYDYVLLALPFARGDPFALLSRWGQWLFGGVLAYAMMGQRIVYGLLSPELGDILFAGMWLGLVALLCDCLRRDDRIQ